MKILKIHKGTQFFLFAFYPVRILTNFVKIEKLKTVINLLKLFFLYLSFENYIQNSSVVENRN